MQLIKIAFSAKMRAGKDTAADYIMIKHPENIFMRKFSSAIDKIVEYFCDLTGEPKNLKWRKFKQFIGTEIGRNRNPRIWINAFEKENRELLDAGYNVLITDVRFKNEYEYCKANGFKMVRINTLDRIRIARGASISDDETTHSSETDLDDVTEWDYIMHNNGSELEFHRAIDKMLLDLYGG